jgi:hypothetical protein
MIGLFNSDQAFHVGGFKCVTCDHETMIFIRDDYDLFGCMESDQLCCNCKQIKHTLSNGDIIMRYDWPDADYDPWQPQCADVLPEDRYCTDCKPLVPKDWRKLVVVCSRCQNENYMVYLDYHERLKKPRLHVV